MTDKRNHHVAVGKQESEQQYCKLICHHNLCFSEICRPIHLMQPGLTAGIGNLAENEMHVNSEMFEIQQRLECSLHLADVATVLLHQLKTTYVCKLVFQLKPIFYKSG